MQQTADLLKNLDLMGMRVDQMEARVSSRDDAEINNQKRAELIISQVNEPTQQMDYLENKSRQNNFCIYNIVEKSEGTNMTAYLKKLFSEALGVPGDLHIMRAHHTSKEQQDSIIVALFDSDTKRRVLQAVWSKEEVNIKETQICFHHDCTVTECVCGGRSVWS